MTLFSRRKIPPALNNCFSDSRNYSGKFISTQVRMSFIQYILICTMQDKAVRGHDHCHPSSLILYKAFRQSMYLHHLHRNNNYYRDQQSVPGLFWQYLFSVMKHHGPLSIITGLIPSSISLNAANSPAGPAPAIITSSCRETSLEAKDFNKGTTISFSEKTSTVRLTRIFFFLASTDRLITLTEEICAGSSFVRVPETFLTVLFVGCSRRTKIQLNLFWHFYSK